MASKVVPGKSTQSIAPTTVRPDGPAPVEKLAQALQQQTQRFAAVLSGGLDVKRLFRLAVESVQRNPKLLEALQQAPETVVSSLMIAAEAGIEVGGFFGHGYLVPLWNSDRRRMECAFWKGYRGVINLLVRSGACLDVEAHVVYEGDQFDLSYGTDPHCRFQPSPRDDRGDPIGCLALYTMPSGKVRAHYMRESHFKKVREAVATRNKGKLPAVWTDWWEDAWRKTTIMHGAKFLGIGPHVDRTLAEHAMRTDEPDAISLEELPTTAPALTSPGSPRSLESDAAEPPDDSSRAQDDDENRRLLAAQANARATAAATEKGSEPKRMADDAAEPPDDAPPARKTVLEVGNTDVLARREAIASMQKLLSGRAKEDPVYKRWADEMSAHGARSWDDLKTDELIWIEAGMSSLADDLRAAEKDIG